jgi:NAD+ diphosphatase
MGSDYRFCPCCARALVRQAVNGSMHSACTDPGCAFVHWDNPVPVVAALIELDGRVLLARNAAWPERVFGLVTGFLERDESPEEAVAREVAEEVGLLAIGVALIGVYPFAESNQLLIAYHVHAVGEIVPNEELAEYRLVEPERLRAWDFGTGPAVRDWLARR